MNFPVRAPTLKTKRAGGHKSQIREEKINDNVRAFVLLGTEHCYLSAESASGGEGGLKIRRRRPFVKNLLR
jgi:hypothetical protein